MVYIFFQNLVYAMSATAYLSGNKSCFKCSIAPLGKWLPFKSQTCLQISHGFLLEALTLMSSSLLKHIPLILTHPPVDFKGKHGFSKMCFKVFSNNQSLPWSRSEILNAETTKMCDSLAKYKK